MTDPPLVGRDAELRRLVEEGVRALESGRGRCLLVEGPAGAGKSAVVEAALGEIRERLPRVRTGTGRCRADVVSARDPCPAFTSALRRAAGMDDIGGSGGLLADLAPPWLAVIPLVGGLLSAAAVTLARLLRRRTALSFSPERLVRRYLEAVEGLVEDGPLVLAVEDLHWADGATTALLGHLCRGIADLPVVVVGTRRPEPGGRAGPLADIVPELERERLALRVRLGELGPEDRRRVVEATLGAPAGAEVHAAVAAVAGGNPLLLREACAAVRERGRRSGGSPGTGPWTLPPDVDLPLPPTAEAMARERLQALAPPEVLLLQYASVEGEAFSTTVLAGLAGRDELEVIEALEGIEREHGVIEVRGDVRYGGGEVGTRYAFASAPLHALLRREVTGRRRVVLDERCREVIDALGGEEVGNRPDDGTPGPRTTDGAPAPTPERAPDVVREPPLRPAAGNGPVPTLVGRDREMELLLREVAGGLSGEGGRVVFIEGAAGAGKSTLARALLERVTAEHPSAALARGRCLPSFESTDPYLPFVTALLDVVDEETAGFMERDEVSELVAELAPYWLGAVPMVGNLLQASAATAAALRESETAEAPSREALFGQYLDLVRGLARSAPLLVYLDDLHWADPSSVELLGHLTRGVGDAPVVVLATLRPVTDDPPGLADLVDELAGEGLARRLALGELAGSSLESLLRVEFGGDVSEPLRRWVTETAGGNPLFATELCRLLRETGAAAPVRDEWELTDAADDLDVPRSAEAAIEVRVRRLEADVHRLLRHATVAGRDFTAALVGGLLRERRREVEDRLREVAAATGLIREAGAASLPDGDRTRRFEFRHALVQTVLYRGLPRKHRILLHRRAGEVLESLHRSAPEEVAGRLARHFHEGDVGRRAYRYGREAAAAARRAFAQWDAEELLEIALAHAEGPGERAPVLEELGEVYEVVAYYDRAVEAYRGALEVSRWEAGPEGGSGVAEHGRGDLPPPLRLRRKMLVVERKGGMAPTSELLERVQELLEEARARERDGAREAASERCHLLLELVRYPDAPDAMAAAREAVETAEDLDDPRLLAQALERLAILLIYDGRPGEAPPLLDRALSLVGPDDPERASFNRNVAGVARAKLGDYPGALEDFRRMLALEERTGDRNGIGAACVNLGQMLLRAGEHEEAESVLLRARKIHRRRDRAGLVHSLFNLAERARRDGETERAAERYRELLEHAREMEYWTSEAVAHAGIGLALLEMGRVGEAREHAGRAVDVIGGREEWFEDREFVVLLLARLDAADGRPGEGARRLGDIAGRLRGADLFPWGMVELERARLLARVDPAVARAAADDVAGEIAGTGSALDAMLDDVRSALEARAGTGAP